MFNYNNITLETVGSDIYAVESNGDIYKMQPSGVFKQVGISTREWNDIEIRDGNIIVNGKIVMATGVPQKRSFEKATFTDPVFQSKPKTAYKAR